MLKAWDKAALDEINQELEAQLDAITDDCVGSDDDFLRQPFYPAIRPQNKIAGSAKEMWVFKDGDSWCFVLPDFQNLQASAAVFRNDGMFDQIYESLTKLNEPI